MNKGPMDIVFYNDVGLFGGHEVMLLSALEAMLEMESASIGVVYSRSNKKLEQELIFLKNRYSGLGLLPQTYTSGKLQFLRSFCSFWAKHQIKSKFQKLSPTCIVVVQGDISLSSVGLLAAKKAGFYTVSYLPMAHTRKIRGERFAGLKDAILRSYYKVPDKYITISNSISEQLRFQGVTCPIDIVENGIQLDSLKKMDKLKARARLNLEDDVYVAAICGRIEFKQKGHDILLESLSHDIEKFKNWRVLVVGDGPDRSALEKKIVDRGLSDIVRTLPWQNSLSSIYSAIDMIVMPSIFEGVPVVMLEAMFYGIPVVGSKIDALNEFIPVDWLVPLKDHKLLSEKMLQISSIDLRQQLEQNRELVVNRFSLKRQQSNFRRVFAECMGKSAVG